ncbi:MAG: hypothetical protein IPM46_09230 [Flavobacteriales bacterium]|nr:hypothetical protein [Flavobacteriales bacterium]
MSFHRWCFLFAVATFTTAAWFGTGYHAEDEYQHVILLAEHLRGNVDAESLPIDYHNGWRSMALPLIASGVFQTAEAVGIKNPFMLALLLRLLTAALSLWVIAGFVKVVLPSVRAENRKAFVIVSWFLWFIPVLHIRFTGEAWSGLLFLRGLTLVLDPVQRKGWAIGAWFGAAVLCRPAAAVLPFGALLWMIFSQGMERKNVLALLAGGASVLIIGILVDSLAYGTFIITLWNYGVAAITGEEAARFTTLPWYQYPLFAMKYATLPIGALMLIALAILLVMRRKHLLLWLLLSFLVAHSILPIKELRFLFPVALLVPWLLVIAWDTLCERWPTVMQRNIVLQLLFPFVVVNAIALVIGMATPAGNGRIKLAEAIHERYGDEAVHIDHLGDWRQWIPPFFLAPHSTEAFTEKIVPSRDRPNHFGDRAREQRTGPREEPGTDRYRHAGLDAPLHALVWIGGWV